MTLRVLAVASEAYPLIKTGGLADVVGALPAALAPHGVEVTTFLPGYPVVMQQLQRGRGAKRVEVLHGYQELMGEKARLLRVTTASLPLIVLDAPGLFARVRPLRGPDRRRLDGQLVSVCRAGQGGGGPRGGDRHRLSAGCCPRP